MFFEIDCRDEIIITNMIELLSDLHRQGFSNKGNIRQLAVAVNGLALSLVEEVRNAQRDSQDIFSDEWIQPSCLIQLQNDELTDMHI